MKILLIHFLRGISHHIFINEQGTINPTEAKEVLDHELSHRGFDNLPADAKSQIIANIAQNPLFTQAKNEFFKTHFYYSKNPDPRVVDELIAFSTSEIASGIGLSFGPSSKGIFKFIKESGISEQVRQSELSFEQKIVTGTTAP